MFSRWLQTAMAPQDGHSLTPTQACGYFAAILLSVPRSINQGELEGPATHYVDQTHLAAMRLLGI